MEVELIKAHDSFDGSARRKIERLRVAAYCRVSTDDEDQIKSYNSMVTHYTEIIKNGYFQVYMLIRQSLGQRLIREKSFSG